ncbi:MAG: hypothetical protein RL701_6267 [Pseudomonadota bacterium]
MQQARWFIWSCLLSVAAACADDDGSPPAKDTKSDAAVTTDAAVTSDASASSSGLERPGLPRPPTTGLPAELRPPR